jgi:hypothetical protein
MLSLHPGVQKRQKDLLIRQEEVRVFDVQFASEHPPKYQGDQCVIFDVGVRVENDILIRGRHYRSRHERISLFRALVHTSFVANNILRLTAD